MTLNTYGSWSNRLHGCTLLVTLILLLQASSTVLARTNAYERNASTAKPTLSISLPSRHGVSEFYFVQPVNVVLTNQDQADALVGLTLKVISNPANHQQVFSARFAASAQVFAINTRVRLAGEGKAIVRAVATMQSGKRLMATGEISLEEGVQFANVDSLTRRLRANVIGLKGPVGTARARLWKKNDTRQFSGIIYHPMLPQIGNRAPDHLVSLKVQYRKEILTMVQFGDAISNDPYVDVRFIDTKPGSGPIKVQWRDNSGKVYKPVTVSIK